MTMRLNLPVSNIERPVPESAILVSKTDLKGIITYCNSALCDITGYSEDELIGKPHSLLRHPDVPAELFAQLWGQIQAGIPWRGLIKNRCKNGDHYWVDANLTPLIEDGVRIGYVSLRYRAALRDVAAAEEYFHAAHEGMHPAPPVKSDSQYIVELQRRLAQKIERLEQYRDANEAELRIGSEIMSRLSTAQGDYDSAIRAQIKPAHHFSGDIFMSARTPSGNLNLILADAVGHGLIAALNLLPLTQIFHGMSKKGFNVSQIAAEMNSKIHTTMPVDRFISAVLISIDVRERLIEVWNGGMPAPVLLGRDGEVMQKWTSCNLPLGLLDDGAFSPEVNMFHFDADSQLFVFSDGFLEAESPEGEQFGIERVALSLRQTAPESRFDVAWDCVEKHLRGSPAHDDISFAMVDISELCRHEQPVPRTNLPRAEEPHSHWKIKIALGEDELKYLDIVPFITDLTRQIHLTSEHHCSLYLILSELFNNALEHGILQLDSAIKQGPDGFETYLKLRHERLLALVSASIQIEIEKVKIDDRYGVKISLVDSGTGFDHLTIESNAMDWFAHGQHGRGIAMVKSLAHRLEYAQHGKEVVAYYVCT